MAGPQDFLGSVIGQFGAPQNSPYAPAMQPPMMPPQPPPAPAQADPETAPMWQRLEEVKGMIHAVDQAFPDAPEPTQVKAGKVPWQALVLGGLQDALSAFSVYKATPQIKYAEVVRSHGGRKTVTKVPYRTQAYGPVGEFGGTAHALSMPIVDAAIQDKANFQQWAKGKSRNEQLKGAVMTRMLDEQLKGAKDDGGTDFLKRALQDGIIDRVEYTKAVRAKILGDPEPSNKLIKEIEDKEAAGKFLAGQSPEEKASLETFNKSQAAQKEAATPDKPEKGLTPGQEIQFQVSDIDREISDQTRQLEDARKEERDLAKTLDTDVAVLMDETTKASHETRRKELQKTQKDIRGQIDSLKQRRSSIVSGKIPGYSKTELGGEAPAKGGAEFQIPADTRLSNGHTFAEYAAIWKQLTKAQQDAIWDDASKAAAGF